jgi:hypothetical protein
MASADASRVPVPFEVLESGDSERAASLHTRLYGFSDSSTKGISPLQVRDQALSKISPSRPCACSAICLRKEGTDSQRFASSTRRGLSSGVAKSATPHPRAKYSCSRLRTAKTHLAGRMGFNTRAWGMSLAGDTSCRL